MHGWLELDPPDADPITPLPPDPLLTPEYLYGAALNYVEIENEWTGIPTTTVKREYYYLISLGWTFAFDLAPFTMWVFVNDSQGQLVGAYGLQIFPGERATDDAWCEFGVGMPRWANLGTATVTVRIAHC